jgi:hypothetical protein
VRATYQLIKGLCRGLDGLHPLTALWLTVGSDEEGDKLIFYPGIVQLVRNVLKSLSHVLLQRWLSKVGGLRDASDRSRCRRVVEEAGSEGGTEVL